MPLSTILAMHIAVTFLGFWFLHRRSSLNFVIFTILISHSCADNYPYFIVEENTRSIKYEINNFLGPLISYATYVPEQAKFKAAKIRSEFCQLLSNECGYHLKVHCRLNGTIIGSEKENIGNKQTWCFDDPSKNQGLVSQGLSGTFVGGYTHVNEEEIFVVDLGGFCNGSYNCRASYTECKDDTCTCLDGFVPTKDLTCQTTRLYCPNLESNVPRPLEPRNVRPCYKFSGQNDTTPCSATSNSSQEFCFLYPLTKTGQNAQVGHCCPKPQIGSKISYGVCPIHPSFHPDMACEGCYEFGEQCVAFRHWSSANSYSFNSQCCPFPCQTTMTNDMISVDGICYLNKYVSESCLLDVQCKTAKSYCALSARNGRTCRCMDGYVPIVRPTPTWQKVSKRTTCVKNFAPK